VSLLSWTTLALRNHHIVNPRTKGIQEVIRLTSSFPVEMLHLASSRAEELAAAVALLDEDHARQEKILGRLVNPSPNEIDADIALMEEEHPTTDRQWYPGIELMELVKSTNRELEVGT
jgi:hypothetical protein